ncbi:MAG: hypothetical protein IIY61_00200 [Ruminococcus sp.]|nr:hypothetical protein [Ruminococcus sp.]
MNNQGIIKYMLLDLLIYSVAVVAVLGIIVGGLWLAGRLIKAISSIPLWVSGLFLTAMCGWVLFKR